MVALWPAFHLRPLPTHRLCHHRRLQLTPFPLLPLSAHPLRLSASSDPPPPSNSDDPAPSKAPSEDEEKADLAELREAMRERREREGEKEELSVGGVLEEVREIEWPVFGRVLGTTWVVLAVIAGSSLVLLTVNAVLAELSDRVFAGRGVQDFFS